MKAPTGKLAFAYRTIAALEVERDTLRAELDACMLLSKIEFDDCSEDTIKSRNAEIAELRAEAERLRQALRSVIVAAGGVAEPGVSSEFLEQAPLEVLALRGNIDQLQARLRRIESVAECGSVQSWLALPDDAKAQWFAMHLEMDEERLNLRTERAQLERIARYLVRAYIVDDQAYNPEAATDKVLARLKEQIK